MTMLTTTHIRNLLALAERARQAGLIQFSEMTLVSDAVSAAQDALKKSEDRTESETDIPEESAKAHPAPGVKN